jgi:hypothetical protein
MLHDSLNNCRIIIGLLHRDGDSGERIFGLPCTAAPYVQPVQCTPRVFTKVTFEFCEEILFENGLNFAKFRVFS